MPLIELNIALTTSDETTKAMEAVGKTINKTVSMLKMHQDLLNRIWIPMINRSDFVVNYRNSNN